MCMRENNLNNNSGYVYCVLYNLPSYTHTLTLNNQNDLLRRLKY